MAKQVLLPQQGWPAPPQAAQLVPTQVTWLAVHVEPVQQPWPAPPQVPQLPMLQVMPMVGQVEPEPVQMLLTQQPPPPQLLPAQQASPTLPQWVQMPWPAPVQTSLASQARPAQQICPGPPQA